MNLNLDKSTWKRVRLGEVIRRSRKQVDPLAVGVERYVAGGHIDSDSLTIDRWGDVDDGQMGSTFRYVFDPGQVLFVSARPYLRKTGVVGFSGVVADKTYVLDAVPENGLLQDFLPLILSSEPFVRYATAEATGSMNPRLLWGQLQRYEFDLPPLDEQKKIADLLWSVEKHRLNLVEETSRIRCAASATIYNCRLESATVVPLGSVATVRNGQSFPRRLQGRNSGDIPFFKVSDLDAIENLRWLTRPGNWITAQDAAEIGASPVAPGAIVTVRVGAALRLERRRMLNQAALVDDNHLVITPTRIDSVFLWAVLSEISLSRNCNDGVIPSLNQKIVRAVEVPDIPRTYGHAVGIQYMRLQEAADSIAEEGNSLRALRNSLVISLFGDG